jgi:Flp pilus assembly protein TadB
LSTQTELPRSVRRGPPITVSCECGEKRDLKYGERWQCERCGRKYDTNRIPMQEYAAIREQQVRQRLVPILAAVVIAAVVVFFTLEGRALAGFVIVPFAVFVWNLFIRPARRKRQYRAIENLPRWKIKAD